VQNDENVLETFAERVKENLRWLKENSERYGKRHAFHDAADRA
jgi:hypothetical protein